MYHLRQFYNLQFPYLLGSSVIDLGQEFPNILI